MEIPGLNNRQGWEKENQGQDDNQGREEEKTPVLGSKQGRENSITNPNNPGDCIQQIRVHFLLFPAEL